MRGLFWCFFLVAAAVVAWAAAPTAEEVLASLPGPVNREEAAILLRPLLSFKHQGLLNLVRFVDTTGAFQHKFVLEDKMNREKLIISHFELHDLTSAQQEDILGMMNAAGYAEQLVGRFPITLEDMLEINARIVNSSSSSHLLTQQGRAWLETDYLSLLNPVMTYLEKQQDAVERGIGAFQLVAWSMDALREGRPFCDGNARVAEVMNAVVLTSVIGLPFPQRVQGHSLLTNALVDLGHGEQLVTNAINALGSRYPFCIHF